MKVLVNGQVAAETMKSEFTGWTAKDSALAFKAAYEKIFADVKLGRD